MIRLSWKKILLGFMVLFALSRSSRIIEALSALDFSGILTLEPLRHTSEEGRFLLTLVVFLGVFVALWSLVKNRK